MIESVFISLPGLPISLPGLPGTKQSKVADMDGYQHGEKLLL